MKRILLLLVLLIVVFGAWYGYREYNRPNATVKDEQATATLAATDLIRAFEKDSAGATKQYNDKIIAVTGPVKKIEADGNPVVIFLGDGAQLSSVQCSMDSTNAAVYASLKTGANTTLKGRVAGFRSDPLFGTDVILNQCVVSTNP